MEGYIEFPPDYVDLNALFAAADAARQNAYAPYSGFVVGAAVQTTDGRVFTGCNVENAAYPSGCCAERVALYKAVSEGVKPGSFFVLAVAGGPAPKPLPDGFGCDAGEELPPECALRPPRPGVYPCGECRQVMMELGGPGMLVLVLDENGKLQEYTMRQLLPHAFT